MTCAIHASSRYASCYSFLLVLGPSALGKVENYLWQWKFKELRYTEEILDDVGINNLRISVTDYSSIILKRDASGTILKFVYFLVVNNNKYFLYIVDNTIFGISVPDYPNRTVETTLLAQFWTLFTFYRKQQQIFIIWCWQLYIRLP